MPSGWSRARCRVCLQLLRVESLTQGLCSSRVSTWRQGVWAGGLGWESGWPWGGRQGSRRLLCSSGGPPPPGSASRPLCSLVQFDCTNTLNDQTLENVTVQMEPTEAYEVLCYVPARSLPYNQPGTCYTLVALPKEDPTAGEPPRPPGSPWVGVGRAACAPAVCLRSELQLLEVCPEQKAGRPALGLCTQQLVSSSHTLRGSTALSF